MPFDLYLNVFSGSVDRYKNLFKRDQLKEGSTHKKHCC